MQAVVQGAIIMAKAGATAEALGCLDHLARYIRQIFAREER
jgi:ATP-dependent protease HslVU (ClpYQ) peptidase subunit